MAVYVLFELEQTDLRMEKAVLLQRARSWFLIADFDLFFENDTHTLPEYAREA